MEIFPTKALGKDREALDEQRTERAVSGHDIRHMTAEKAVDQLSHKDVPTVVERALVLREICGGKAVADHHVVAVAQYAIRHGTGVLRRVSVVSVDHQIALRIDLAEHRPDHVALALSPLVAHDGAGGAGDLVRPVGGVVVVNIDRGIRQRRTVILHYLGDGGTFVVARYQNGNFIHVRPPFPALHPKVLLRVRLAVRRPNSASPRR